MLELPTQSDHDGILVSYNWHDQKLARRLVEDLRKAGFKVQHALESKELSVTTSGRSFCVITLLSQAYEDSAAARKELTDAVENGCKVLSILVDKQYVPKAWVKEFCDKTVLLHVYEYTDEELEDCIRTLRKELVKRRPSTTIHSLSTIFARVANSSAGLWGIQDSYNVVSNVVGLKFVYVCLQADLKTQKSGPSTPEDKWESQLLSSVFAEFCIFEDDVSIHVSRIFMGPEGYIFVCLQGEEAAIDTILDHKVDFLDNMKHKDRIDFFSYDVFRDAMFSGRPGGQILPTSKLREMSSTKYEMIFLCLHGMPVKSKSYEVEDDIACTEIWKLVRKWLNSQGVLNVLVWDSNVAIFRKVERSKSLTSLWDFGQVINKDGCDYIQLQLLIEPLMMQPLEFEKFALVPSERLQWQLLASLQDPISFNIDCVISTTESRFVLSGTPENMAKLWAGYTSGELERFCGIKLSLQKLSSPNYSQKVSIHQLQDSVTDKNRNDRLATKSKLAHNKRFHRMIRGIESNLGVIRPAVSKKLTVSGQSRRLRDNYILFGVHDETRVTEQVQNTARIGASPVNLPQPKSAEIQSMRSPSLTSSKQIPRQDSASAPPVVDDFLSPSCNMTPATAIPVTVDDSGIQKSDSLKTTKHRKQMNKLVQLLRSTRSYRSEVQVGNAAQKQNKSKRQHRRHSSLDFDMSSLKLVAASDPGNDSKIEAARSSALGSGQNSRQTSEESQSSVTPTSNIGIAAEIRSRSFNMFEIMSKSYHNNATGDAVPLDYAKNFMIDSGAGFHPDEVDLIFSKSGVNVAGTGMINAIELHQICYFGYFGHPEATVQTGNNTGESDV